MKKAFLLLFFLLAAAGLANASYFNYSIELEGDGAVFTTTIGLESATPANSFKLNGFLLPENSTVISIKDTIGEIEDYTLAGGKITFESNKGAARLKETVELKYSVEGVKGKGFSPLYFAEFSLPASEGSDVSVEVKGERVISFESNTGFNGEVRDGVLKMAGQGPAWFACFYSNEGKDYNHYVLFNKSGHSDTELEEHGVREADKLFDIIPLIIGIKPPFEKIPVVALEESEYLAQINSYSEGVYRTGGIIVVNGESFEKDASAVILHETTHAFNAQALEWNESGTAWFDEGTAKFVENLIRGMRGERKANLFRGKVSWIEGSYRYTIEPRGNFNDLVAYLNEKKGFMEEWNTDTEETREFGYAFSELYVREYVREKGYEKLQEAYRGMLEINESTKSREEFSSRILGLLGKELYPCDKGDEVQIQECVNALNKASFDVPEKTTVLQLGLEDEEFESAGKMHEMKKKALAEKLQRLRESLLGIADLVFPALEAKKAQILAGVRA